MKTETIDLCPFRVSTQRLMSATVAGEYTERAYFETCLKSKCPAWYSVTENIPATGYGHEVEYCLRLSRSRM